MKDLLRKIQLFNRERDWEQYHSPKNLAMALIVEAGELAEHFQWLSQEESRNLSPEKLAKVKEEIGDVLIYLAILADHLNLDPVEAAHAKLEKNRIKYPAEIVTGKSLKYTDYE